MVRKIKTKPVIKEAIHFHAKTSENWHKCREFIKGNYDNTLNFPNIITLEGTMRVSPGDWIIKGIKGEFYPCKPEVFEATYELVE